MAEWVLDTWALRVAQDYRHPKSLQTLALLEEIKQRHRIAIDHGGLVLVEYRNNAPWNTHAGQWLNLILSRSNNVFSRTGKLSRRHESDLLEGLHFDKSDLVFLALASEGPDKFLVAEESDYSAQVREYLAEELGVTVLTIEQALETAKGLQG